MKKVSSQCARVRSRGTGAFTLMESVVATAVVGIVFIALYAGITSSFLTVRLARENLRATQVMLEKMEVIRLYTWDQVNSNNFVPVTFTAPYSPSGTNAAPGDLLYRGRITISPLSSLPNAHYTNDLRLVTVEVIWKTKNQERSRKMSTYVSRYGIQNYVLN